MRPACSRLSRILVIAAAATISAASAFGADFSGIWTGQIVDRNGDPQDLSFRFTQTGNALVGKQYGDNESTPIKDASVSGEQLTFTVTTELNGAISTFLYTGTADGNEMELTRSRVDATADPPATKPPAAAGTNAARSRQGQKLHLKRLV